MRLAYFRRKLRTYPLCSAFLITILFALLLFAGMPFADFISGIPYGAVILTALVTVLCPVLVILCGYGHVYRDTGFFRTLGAGAMYVVMESLALLSVFTLMAAGQAQRSFSIWLAGGIVLEMFAVGVREESIFRGLLVNLIGDRYIRDRKGVWITVFVSGTLFGLMHLLNILHGVAFSSAVVQALTACGIGWAMGAVYLRGGSLWAMIFLHTLIDTVSFFSVVFLSGLSDTVEAINTLGPVNLIPAVYSIALTVFLLRKSQSCEIIERFRIRNGLPVSGRNSFSVSGRNSFSAAGRNSFFVYGPTLARTHEPKSDILYEETRYEI